MFTDEQHEQLLRCHCGPPMPLPDLAARCGLTLTDLAAWLRSPRAKEDLAALRAGSDLNTQIYLSQHRGLAAAKLVDIISDDNPSETKRRAAKDILTINVAPLPPEPEASNEPPELVITPEAAEIINDRLERRGESDKPHRSSPPRFDPHPYSDAAPPPHAHLRPG